MLLLLLVVLAVIWDEGVTGCRFNRGGDEGTRAGVCSGCSGLVFSPHDDEEEDGCVEEKNRGGADCLLIVLLDAAVVDVVEAWRLGLVTS